MRLVQLESNAITGTASGGENGLRVPSTTRSMSPVGGGLLQRKAEDPWGYYTETRPTPSAGLGVFAVRDIPRGTRLAAEEPLLSVPAVANENLYSAVCEALQTTSAKNLALLDNHSCDEYTLKVANTGEIRKKIIQWYMDLPDIAKPYSNITELNEIVNQTCRRYAIFLTNNLDMGLGLGAGLFPCFSRMNHSCTPNTFDVYNITLRRLTIHAARDIKRGEQLHSVYIEPMWPRERRLKKLRAWGFECTCAVCSDDVLEAMREETFRLDDSLAEYLEWLDEGGDDDDDLPFLRTHDEAWDAAKKMVELLLRQGLGGDALFNA
ncbi:hypothetical protein jhhlp_004814 [Lomentospora prolificans]|uniref:SET domain-containing protein n=1 Tax=Lomentospora prolificans TaxID=41688 RepID=A0A2N3N8I7_9PEZI|nr:hypothetical protein jhhlp_004814 [Lomentospora prolificans]